VSYDEPKRIIMLQDYGLESDYCAPAPTVIAKIPMGARTGDVVISPDNSLAYVARSNSIAVISRLNNILGIIPISGDPKGLTINADGSRLYVTDHEGSVSVVDVADHWIRVLPGASSAQEVVTADRALIYTAHNAKHDGRCTSWISVNDTEGATVATIPGVGGYAITDLAVDPNGTRAYAGLSGYSS
jgi:DNA-binding beta-propeller fold protein YncE